jgi:iron-sulfur cluster repair protein YtfE (RIC family)
MQVYDVLIKDHHVAREIFKRLKETDEGDLEERERLFEELHTELSVHLLAEEKFFYPAIQDAHATHEKSLEALEEHNVVKILLGQLGANDKGTEEWLAKLKVLDENVEHHVKEEEEDIFPKSKKVLSAAEAERIGSAIEEHKSGNMSRKE